MQDKISEIEIRNVEYKKLKLKNIVTEKAIYRFGEFCDVKLVHIQQPDEGVVFSEDIKSRKYTLKVIYKERIRAVSDNYQRQYQNIFNEIYALYLISHPNVVKIYWHFQDDESIYLLTEHAGATLYKYVHKTTLNEEKIKPIFKQICQGLEAIHYKKIVHRDLSLDNIVINTQTNQVKIIDFGNAIEFTGGRTTALGTLTIMAPQVYHQKRYNCKADIWSLGVILFQLFHKRNPFVNQEQQYTQEEFSQKRDRLQYTIDESIVSGQAKKLIVKMLSINPQHRPLPEQILSSLWISGQKPISSKFILQKQISEEQQLANNFNPLSKQNEHSINEDNLQKDHANFPQQQDKKTKQISNRKSFFALSEDQLSNHKNNKMQVQKQIQENNHQDDFYFDKIINKMSLSNNVQQLQQRLRRLLKIKAQELAKNRQLTLKLLSSEKRKLQKEKDIISNTK